MQKKNWRSSSQPLQLSAGKGGPFWAVHSWPDHQHTPRGLCVSPTAWYGHIMQERARPHVQAASSPESSETPVSSPEWRTALWQELEERRRKKPLSHPRLPAGARAVVCSRPSGPCPPSCMSWSLSALSLDPLFPRLLTYFFIVSFPPLLCLLMFCSLSHFIFLSSVSVLQPVCFFSLSHLCPNRICLFPTLVSQASCLAFFSSPHL